MSLFSGRKLRILFPAFLLSAAFLFCLSSQPAQAYHATSSYSKPLNGTLTSANWNDLFSDFVNTWLPTTLNGPLGIGTTIPPSSGLYVNGPVSALNLYSTSNVGIGKTNPGSALDMIGSINSSGTINGTGLCIANDCKVSWLAVGASSSGWTLSGSNVYKSDTAGNVGIGTTGPGSQLDITRTWGGGTSASTDYIIRGYGGNVSDTNYHIFEGMHGASERFFVSGAGNGYFAGNVGIGTTNPTAKLEISQSDSNTTFWNRQEDLIIRNTNGTNNTYSLLGFRATSNVAAGVLAQYYDAANSYASLNFATRGASGWNGAVMTLRDGNVGIGTTTPTQKLSVAGIIESTTGGFKFPDGTTQTTAGGGGGGTSQWTTASTSIYYNGGNVGIGTTAPGAKLEVNGTTILDNTLTLNGAGAAIEQIWKGGTWYHIKADASNTFNVFEDGYETTRNIVLRGGNVGIGTTTPAQKLQVAGTIRTALSGSGNRCVYVDASGDLYAKTADCGTASGGDNLGNHIATQNIQLGSYWLSGDGGKEDLAVTSLGNVGIMKTNPTNALDIVGGINASGTVNGTGLCIAGDCKVSWPAVGAASAGWSTNGTAVYKSDTSGNVGIGTTNPTAAKLTISGDLSATGATLSGALVMNGGGTNQNISGVNKLTVNTIDPLYYIKGVNYSSYASSIIGGVKEEYVGKIRLDKKNKVVQEFEAVLDFSAAEEGSELWLWRQVVDFDKDHVDVLITPYGRLARTYYFLDGEKLVFRSDSPVEISYRLVGKRFDWRQWPTRALDQTERGMEVR
jgi:hypothetical protein